MPALHVATGFRPLRLGTMDYPRVYRFLDRPEYADAFCRGAVRLSTLEACRRAEAEHRRDVGEGSLEYLMNFAPQDAGNPKLRKAERLIRENLQSDLESVTIVDCVFNQVIPDAFVLCTTTRCDTDAMREFGPHCVEIFSPNAFFQRLSRALSKRRKLVSAIFGRVKYHPRRHGGEEPAPGVIGFVKPPDKYEREQEARMLWEVEGQPLEPLIIDYAPLGSLCRRIA